MALQAQVTLNYASMVAGQTPTPQATLSVYNPNASPVLVTGAQVYVQTLAGQRTPSFNPPLVPLTAGFCTVPALGTLTFGPFSITVPSMSNVNVFQMVGPSGSSLTNTQPTQPPQMQLQVGAFVFGSDGSNNTAGVAPLLVSFTSNPPMNFQGGPLQFGLPNNLALGFVTGVL